MLPVLKINVSKFNIKLPKHISNMKLDIIREDFPVPNLSEQCIALSSKIRYNSSTIHYKCD